MRKFHLVDFAAQYQKGFRNRVVSITEVPALVQSFEAHGCYSTYFFYCDEILSYMTARAADSKASVGGYDGKVWASVFPIDLDHQDLSVALESARHFVSLFLDQWQIDPKGLQIYFSGLKGFHLMLDARLFGRLSPSKTLPVLFAAIRRHLVQELPAPYQNTLDLSIKDKVRLLRLPNTRHENSECYKIILSAEELRSLGPDRIRDLARQPRPLEVTDETGLIPYFEVGENAEASRFFQHVKKQVRRLTRKKFEYQFRRPEDLSELTFRCLGVQKIWENRIEPGFRNNCAIRLASELRLLGLTESEAREKLGEWNKANEIELPDWELDRVIHSAFQHEFPYRYGCNDDILRHFCPLASPNACRSHVARYSKRFSAKKPATPL